MENPSNLLRTFLYAEQGLYGKEHHHSLGTTHGKRYRSLHYECIEDVRHRWKEKLLPPSNVLSYGRLSRMVSAMTCIECGIPYREVDTEAVAQGYKLAFPANREKLDKWLLDEDEYRYW